VAHLDVACGGNHTLVLRTSGAAPPEIFSWGLNSEGQCGVGSLERLLQVGDGMCVKVLMCMFACVYVFSIWLNIEGQFDVGKIERLLQVGEGMCA